MSEVTKRIHTAYNRFIRNGGRVPNVLILGIEEREEMALIFSRSIVFTPINPWILEGGLKYRGMELIKSTQRSMLAVGTFEVEGMDAIDVSREFVFETQSDD